MSAELTTATVAAGEVVFDSNLKVGQVRKMSSSGGDIDTIIEVMSTIVHSWPYDGDPAELESWDNLDMKQFNEIAQVITEELGKELS